MLTSKPDAKRGLEYGVRAPVFYGNLREQTVFHEYLQEACFVFIQKSPKISGNLREFTGKCNLRITYSSSLLDAPIDDVGLSAGQASRTDTGCGIRQGPGCDAPDNRAPMGGLPIGQFLTQLPPDQAYCNGN